MFDLFYKRQTMFNNLYENTALVLVYVIADIGAGGCVELLYIL